MATGLNVGAALLLAAALVVLANYISARRFVRHDWSAARFFSLSDKTRQLLAGFPTDIHITVFLAADHESYNDIKNLLREYSSASARVRVQYVDPDRDLALAKDMARKYSITEPNIVLFEVDGRSRQVQAAQVAEYDFTPLLAGKPKRKVAFRGEQVFSSAIQSLTQTRTPVVYFLRGHEERDIAKFDNYSGYSKIAKLVQRDAVDVRPLSLGEAGGVPTDCSALVVAGPAKRLPQAEIDLIRQYLARSGRAMFLLDAGQDGGLSEVLAEWGVKLGDDRVAGMTLTGLELFVTQFGNHPITRNLRNVACIFYVPRSVEPLDAGGAERMDKPRVTPLAMCSSNGWAEVNANQRPPKFDKGVDRLGPISVAVAVEKGPAPGMHVELSPTRLVVVGDSDFVSNGALAGGNEDFFMNALNWLLERERLMAIAPKVPDELRIDMRLEDVRLLFLLVVVGIPAGVALVGYLVWLRRR